LVIVLTQPGLDRYSIQSQRVEHMTSKAEVAFQTLLKQGHNVQAVVRGNAVWFDIDGDALVSWDQMSEFADGLHTFDELRDLDRRRTQIALKSA